MECFKSEYLLELSIFLKENLKDLFNDYSFYFISDVFDFDQNLEIEANLKDSKAIIIKICKGETQNNSFFIISFNKTLIIINQILHAHLKHLLSIIPNIPIYTFNDVKEALTSLNITLSQQIGIDSSFTDYINDFCRDLNAKKHTNSLVRNLWQNIQQCIAGYLFMESYIKLIDDQKSIEKKFDHIQAKKSIEINIWDQNFINLKFLGLGSSSYPRLVYHITKKKLFVLKFFKYEEHKKEEASKLIEREINNYSKMNYPLIPKFYGITNIDGNKHLIIQYINGQTLEKIENVFKFDEKIKIIFGILIIINYLHKNNFVYRDLKPNNVIVDENKTVFLIDFDKTINLTEISEDYKCTEDFQFNYSAPELFLGKISLKADIYSIGKMICYIMNEKFPKNGSSIENSILQEIFQWCTIENDSQKRPSIEELMFVFYKNFSMYLNSPIFEKDQEVQKIKLSIQNLKNNLKFQKLPSNFECDIDKINNDIIKNIYSQFNFVYFDFSFFTYEDLNEKRKIIENSLFSFIREKKFITYQIFENGLTMKSNVIFCVEKQCLFFESLDNRFLKEQLNNTESILLNSTEKNSLHFEEVRKFCSNFSDIIKQNEFVRYSIYSIVCYLIRRYFQPSYFFNDKSFFALKKSSIISSLFELFQSVDLQKNEHIEELIKSNFKKKQNEIDDAKFNFFDEKEFIKLRVLNSSNQKIVYLVIHIPSLYLCVIKEFNDDENEKTFCQKNSHHCFTNFYGFIKKDGKITGFIYEFMSNGTLKDYILNNKNHINEIFSITSMMRIFEGINYLHSLSIVHRNLNPMNFLVDHDNNIYFSDFNIKEEERKNSFYYSSPEQYKDENINCQTDFYSIGLIIYFLFEKKEFFDGLTDDMILNAKENEKLPIIQNCTDSIRLFYNKCIKLNPNERPKLNDFQNKLLIETKFNSMIKEYFLNQHFTFNEVINYFSEKLSFLIQIEKKAEALNHLEEIFAFNSIIVIVKIKNQNLINSIELPSFSINDIIYAGDLFYYGKYVKKNYLKSIKLYELAIPDSYANYQLGNIYIKNSNTYIKGINYLTISQAKGNIEAALKLGYKFYDDGRYVESRINFEISSEKYKSESFLMLGKIYFNGSSKIIQNFETARKYFELSAKENNSEAYLFLGKLYFYGYGVEKNIKKGLFYYEKSSFRNNSESCYILGNLYYDGEFVNEDIKKAIGYYELSAKENNPDALLKLGYIHWIGTKVVRNVNKSIEYFKRLIEYNKSENRIDGSFFIALNEISLIYIIDDSFKFYNQQILSYIKEAASLGYPIAQNNLGLIYFYYENNEKDAIDMFEQSSKSNFPLADFNLAQYYDFKSQICDKEENISKSIKYYKKAIDEENNQIHYKNRIIHDVGIESSIKYVLALAKMKLCIYYLKENDAFQAFEYFFKLFLNINDFINSFNYVLFGSKKSEFNSKLVIAYIFLKMFFSYFINFKNAVSVNDDLKTQLFKSQIESAKLSNIILNLKYIQGLIKSSNDCEKLLKDLQLNISQDNEINSISFNQTKDLFPYLDDQYNIIHDKSNQKLLDMYKDPNNLTITFFEMFSSDPYSTNLFISSFSELIKDFNDTLYKKPYDILFGRLTISPKHKINGENIDELFYEGFGI